MDAVSLIVVGIYAFAYFTFGLRGARNFVDNKLANYVQGKKPWVRTVWIAVAALFFAYIEFARLILLGIFKLLQIFGM